MGYPSALPRLFPCTYRQGRECTFPADLDFVEGSLGASYQLCSVVSPDQEPVAVPVMASGPLMEGADPALAATLLWLRPPGEVSAPPVRIKGPPIGKGIERRRFASAVICRQNACCTATA